MAIHIKFWHCKTNHSWCLRNTLHEQCHQILHVLEEFYYCFQHWILSTIQKLNKYIFLIKKVGWKNWSRKSSKVPSILASESFHRKMISFWILVNPKISFKIISFYFKETNFANKQNLKKKIPNFSHFLPDYWFHNSKHVLYQQNYSVRDISESTNLDFLVESRPQFDSISNFKFNKIRYIDARNCFSELRNSLKQSAMKITSNLFQNLKQDLFDQLSTNVKQFYSKFQNVFKEAKIIVCNCNWKNDREKYRSVQINLQKSKDQK